MTGAAEVVFFFHQEGHKNDQTKPCHFGNYKKSLFTKSANFNEGNSLINVHWLDLVINEGAARNLAETREPVSSLSLNIRLSHN